MAAAVRRDRYDLPLGTSSAAAVDRYVEGVDLLLSQNVGSEALLRSAIAADQRFALAHAALALTAQLQGARAEAEARIEHARALVAASGRERGHVEALAAAIAGDGGRALALIRGHLDQFPRDALLLRQATLQIQLGGTLTWQQDQFDLPDTLAPHYGDDWWFLSVFSNAHHELYRFGEAQHLAERSLALYPRNAGGAHHLSHVFYETADHSAGAHFLGGWLAGYDRQAGLHRHLSWHLTIFELAGGFRDRVIERYERDIAPAAGPNPPIADAASLIWRLTLTGRVPSSLPWDPLQHAAERLVGQPGFAFGDLHTALALAGAHDRVSLRRLIGALSDLDAAGDPLAGSVALPIVRGIAAFVAHDYDEAARTMEPAMEQLVRVGGSNAQREVFEETLLHAYLRSGRHEQAAALLHARNARRQPARDPDRLGQSATTSDCDEP